MADHNHQYHGVFVRGDEHPLAIYSDADLAARASRADARDTLVAPLDGFTPPTASSEVRDALKAPAESEVLSTDPLARLRAEARTALTERILREELEKEESASVRKNVKEVLRLAKLTEEAGKPDYSTAPFAQSASSPTAHPAGETAVVHTTPPVDSSAAPFTAPEPPVGSPEAEAESKS